LLDPVITGLQDAEPAARVTYHAGRLSLLAAQELIIEADLRREKGALDIAFEELFSLPKEQHAGIY